METEDLNKASRVAEVHPIQTGVTIKKTRPCLKLYHSYEKYRFQLQPVLNPQQLIQDSTELNTYRIMRMANKPFKKLEKETQTDTAIKTSDVC